MRIPFVTVYDIDFLRCLLGVFTGEVVHAPIR
jgi:hypothetical protein